MVEQLSNCRPDNIGNSSLICWVSTSVPEVVCFFWNCSASIHEHLCCIFFWFGRQTLDWNPLLFRSGNLVPKLSILNYHFAQFDAEHLMITPNEQWCTNRRRGMKWWGRDTGFLGTLETSGVIYWVPQCPFAPSSFLIPCITFPRAPLSRKMRLLIVFFGWWKQSAVNKHVNLL